MTIQTIQTAPTPKTSKQPKFTTLFWLISIFIIPIVAARLLFIFHDSVDLKISPKGELISPPVHISTLGWNSSAVTKTAIETATDTAIDTNGKDKWQIVYLRPPHCTFDCKTSNTFNTFDCDQDYELLKRVHLSLGKNQSRVVIQQIPHTLSSPWKAKSVLIVDPKGFLIMVYPSSNPNAGAGATGAGTRTGEGSPQHEGASQHIEGASQPIEALPPNTFDARGLLTDIRRLLRFSND